MFTIGKARLIGKFRHVIQVNLPCGKELEIKGPSGEAPTLIHFLEEVKQHRDYCEICGSEETNDL